VSRIIAEPSCWIETDELLLTIDFKEDLDYLIRVSMVIIFLFSGYQKWFQYEAEVLVPYISNGPLIFWLYPVFCIRGATWFFRELRGTYPHANLQLQRT
jgi:uncharacterized membrane protein YkgB